jgi:short-subunit dehydrogenase
MPTNLASKRIQRFVDKVVLIVGATGGLGSAYARTFAADGATVILAARRPEALTMLTDQLPASGIIALDLADPDSIRHAAATIADLYPNLSIVVNATGVDVRKPLDVHSLEEIDQSLTINLRGSILLTQAFLPLLKTRGDGVIVHMGGFADGRLAFPFYSVDVATRSGLRGFVDAMNRELVGSGVVVSYFSPSPADTEAERPFHGLWRQLGVRIESPEQVAHALLDAVSKKQAVHIMGGWLTRLFATINVLSPMFANLLVLNAYRLQMARFFNIPLPSKGTPASKPIQIVGIVLIILSFFLYGFGLLVVPFVTLEGVVKVALVPVLLLVGEVSFWIGAAIVGKQLITRYRKYLNPCNWRLGRST